MNKTPTRRTAEFEIDEHGLPLLTSKQWNILWRQRKEWETTFRQAKEGAGIMIAPDQFNLAAFCGNQSSSFCGIPYTQGATVADRAAAAAARDISAMDANAPSPRAMRIAKKVRDWLRQDPKQPPIGASDIARVVDVALAEERE